MTNKQDRRVEYLAKALKAKSVAARSTTLKDREKWGHIAEAYLVLAAAAPLASEAT